MNITKQIAQLTRQGKCRPRTVPSLRRNQLRRLLLEPLESRQLLAADNPLLLSSLNGTTGFRIDGVAAGDFSGIAVSTAGDVNGDGYDDVVIGASGASSSAGKSFVVFGKSSGFPAAIALGSLDGTNGFRIDGVDANDSSGRSVSSAGDINGDGFADLIIGAQGGDVGISNDAGESYVLFGKATGFAASIALSSLDGTNGFRITGIDTNDLSGRSVSGAGDVNGDGYDDLIIGANNGDPGGITNAGESYVVFGKAGSFAPVISLSSLDGSDGFRIDGVDSNDFSGRSVSSAGDVNGDGFADLIIGAFGADPGGNLSAGESHVVFGTSSGFSAVLTLSSLDGTNGFRIDGIDASDFSGFPVSAAGDINGDGFDDLIIGAYGADQGANLTVGETYVLFGKASGFAASIALSSLNGINGFRLDGIDAGDFSGYSVSAAGDLNGDGFDDLVIGALGGDPSATSSAGETYVLFGKSGVFTASISLSSLNGTNGFRLEGIDANDQSGRAVSSAGDVNGDGFGDLIIGAVNGDPGGNVDAGESYVVFGGNFTGGTETQLGTSGNDTLTANEGSNAIDILIGGLGNDVLISDGGSDVLLGGHGDDTLAIPDVDFSGTRRLVGGSGVDTLRLEGSDLSLDLTIIADNRIVDFEQIDLGSGNAHLLKLTSLELRNLSTHSNTVTVLGSGSAVHILDGGWSAATIVNLGGNDFRQYTNGSATLNLAIGLSVRFPVIDLANLHPTTGMTIFGADAGDQSGFSVSGAGDVNGDGFDDYLIGAPAADAAGNAKTNAGESYLVFGGAALPATLDLANLGTAGVTIFGGDANDSNGRSVSNAGDINGDGFDDLILGANSAGSTGASYVIWGKADWSTTPTIDLASLGSAGLTIFGADAADNSGIAVSGAGDINGDGFDDLIIGANFADASGNAKSIAGESYVIFGAESLPSTIDLGNLGSAGITLFGADAGDRSGVSVSGGGDFNGDGFDDLIVGAFNSNGADNEVPLAGESYVIFGKANWSSTLTIDLANLGSAGMTIFGADASDGSGVSVSSAGDVNGDGFSDFVIGAQFAYAAGNFESNAGESYLIFGGPSLPQTLHLANLGSAGITIFGAEIFDRSGSVANAGDVNGDGFDDLLIGAFLADSVGNTRHQGGESYLIFGGDAIPETIDLHNLGTDGITIFGVDTSDRSGSAVSSVGDVNGDGFDDLLVGAPQADASGNAKSNAGESYVIYGGDFIGVVTHQGTAAAETLIGDATANVMIGGRGDDVLVGNGGADVLHGGEGDDILAISDLHFKRIVGGNGVDTLRLDGSGFTLDSTMIADSRIQGIEVIDLSGSGNNTLVLSQLELLNLSTESNTLSVRGNAGDRVKLLGSWAEVTSETIGSDTFRVFTQGAARLQVLLGVSIQLTSIDLANFGLAGTTIYGADSGDQSGWSVSDAGDVNGDGFDDFIIGAFLSDGAGNSKINAGESYVVFGAETLPATIDLANLGSAGITIVGADMADRSGASVSSAGDINGDGFDDLLIGAVHADAFGNVKPYAGDSYVVFGKADWSTTPTIDLANLGFSGITFFGPDAEDQSGFSISGAGDVNGDGFYDLLIGAPLGDAAGNAKTNAGESYLIFGSAALPATIDLANLGSAGITIFGADSNDQSGFSASAAGDINGDGFDDIVVGALGGDASGNAKLDAGESYVIFGKADWSTTPSIDLANLGSAGVTIIGADAGDLSGRSVSNAGDVNGDGFDDLIIGAELADAWENAKDIAGESYVIFGKADWSTTPMIDLSNLGSAGIIFFGADPFDQSGYSVSSAGDVNGDGFDDLLIGAPGGDASENAKFSGGDSYLIFGKADWSTTLSIDLSNLHAIGITLFGADSGDSSGAAVSSAGDVNGDGFDDLLIGAPGSGAAENAKPTAGESYLIFGSNDFTNAIHAANLGTSSNETIIGTIAGDIINGAYGDDTLLGGGGADVLLGGRGNDILAINDLNFKRIVGGNGFDTLSLDGSGITLDLTTIANNRIIDIEQIDITGSGDNTLVLDYQEVLNISSTSNTVIVRRDVGDVVSIGSGWIQVADESIAGDAFEVYVQGAATLKIHRLDHDFTMPSGNGLDVFSLRRNGEEIELYDDAALIDSIRIPLLGSFTLRAAAAEANRFDIDYASGGFFAVPDGITFVGSSGSDDLRIIGDGNTFATFISAGPVISNGSLLISDGGPTTSIAFTGIEPLSISGMLSVDVNGVLGVGTLALTIDAATYTQLGSAITLTGGTINAPGGLHLGAAKVIQARGTINAPVSSEVGSTINLTGNLTIGDVTAFDGINLAGRLNIGANTVTLRDGHKAVLGSQTTLGTSSANGTLNSTFGVELPDARTFVGRGTINTASGQFENQGFVQGNGPGLTFNHLVTGRGDFGGTIHFLGGFSPGNSPAKVTAENITFGQLNTHQAEIGGLIAGNEFDQVNASATVTLDGTLEVLFLNLGNGYTPAAGQSFDIITASNLSGTFSNVILPALPDGLNWDVVYQTDRVTLEIEIAMNIVLSDNLVVEKAIALPTDETIGTMTAIDPDTGDSHTFALINGVGPNDNSFFIIDEDQLLIKAGTIVDFETKPSYVVHVQVTDSQGDTFAKDLLVAVGNRGELTIVTIGDGTAQRSRVSGLQVTFDSEVEIEADAFTVLKRGTGGGPVGVSFTTTIDGQGRTVAALTFSGGFTQFGSLVDGNYELLIDGNRISDSYGNLDLDEDGTDGGTYRLGDEATDAFFRMFGDVSGDRTVGFVDFVAFRNSFGANTGNPSFDDRFDFDENDTVGFQDFVAFRNRFGSSLPF